VSDGSAAADAGAESESAPAEGSAAECGEVAGGADGPPSLRAVGALLSEGERLPRGHGPVAAVAERLRDAVRAARQWEERAGAVLGYSRGRSSKGGGARAGPELEDVRRLAGEADALGLAPDDAPAVRELLARLDSWQARALAALAAAAAASGAGKGAGGGRGGGRGGGGSGGGSGGGAAAGGGLTAAEWAELAAEGEGLRVGLPSLDAVREAARRRAWEEEAAAALDGAALSVRARPHAHAHTAESTPDARPRAHTTAPAGGAGRRVEGDLARREGGRGVASGRGARGSRLAPGSRRARDSRHAAHAPSLFRGATGPAPPPPLGPRRARPAWPGPHSLARIAGLGPTQPADCGGWLRSLAGARGSLVLTGSVARAVRPCDGWCCAAAQRLVKHSTCDGCCAPVWGDARGPAGRPVRVE
jgi:hypothetical protein